MVLIFCPFYTIGPEPPASATAALAIRCGQRSVRACGFRSCVL